MPDEKIEVNYVRWRLGNSYKCKELLASFFNRFVVNLCFLLNSGQSAPGPIAVSHFGKSKATDKTIRSCLL